MRNMRELILSLIALTLCIAVAPASEVAHQPLSGMICVAESVIVGEVVRINPSIEVQATRDELADAEDMRVWEYLYRVKILQQNPSQLKAGTMDFPFFYRESKQVSFGFPTSGIESNLEEGKQYVFLVSRGARGRLEIIRAEPISKQKEVFKAFNSRECTNEAKSLHAQLP